MADLKFDGVLKEDAELVDAIARFANELGASSATIQIQPIEGHPDVHVPLEKIESNAFVALARSLRTSFWPRINLVFQYDGNASLSVTRGPGAAHHYRVSFPNQDSRPEQALTLVSIAYKTLGPALQTADLATILGPEMAEFYQRREAHLVQLETLTQRLVTETNDYRLALDKQAAEKAERHEAAWSKRLRELEDQFDLKRDALLERERLLKEEQARFDDRSAQHVRRDAVKGLKGIITSRASTFSLTRDTRRKRIPIHGIFCALLAVSVFIVYHGFAAPPAADESGPALWLKLLRIPTGILGFAFSALFYIRWNDAWFRQHADEEFYLRHLELDIDRASWVTELALELRDEKGDLPAALLERLSVGLFTSRASEPVRHPSQDLLSTIIGASSRLKLTLPGGIEADVNRSGIKKVQDELAKQ